jgi:hypothetical protein
MSCQGRGRTYKFFTASRMADRFWDVEKKIDSYLLLIPAISYICKTSRLDANHNTARSQYKLVLSPIGSWMADRYLSAAQLPTRSWRGAGSYSKVGRAISGR